MGGVRSAPVADRRRCVRLSALVALAAVRAEAHEGPPFPILMDAAAGPHVVSVWADPDIGEATFYVIVEDASGRQPSDLSTVALWVEPTTGRLARATYAAQRQKVRNRVQYMAAPHFDQRDQWRVGIVLTSSDGSTAELLTQVESTPPGYGAWDLAVYGAPFGLVGGLWLLALLRRSRRAA